MAGWQDAPIVEGSAQPSWMDAPIVDDGAPAPKAAGPQALPDGYEIVATTPDNGRVYRKPDGALGFTSPGYATTDQDAVNRILDGATPVEIVQSGTDRQVLQSHPIAARGAKFIQGVPFAGSYADEAVGAMFGDDAAAAFKRSHTAIEREKPVQSAALRGAGTAVGAVAGALAAAPSMVGSGATLGAQAVQAAGIGAAAGGVEGLIYGAGEGEGAGRKSNALEGGAVGAAAGGVLGPLAVYGAAGVKSLIQRMRGSDIGVISKQLGTSKAASKVIKEALDTGDIDGAVAALNRAGPDGMLADAGQPARELLDASAQSGGNAGRIARDAVDGRARQSSDAMQATLDKFLGKPNDVADAKSAIRTGTANARKAAYDAAYAAPIDYSQGPGQAIEGLMERVPQSAVKRANELMRLEGAESGQIVARIADNGAVSFDVLPDVRQLDYITRALNDVADQADGQGKLGGTTALGRATQSLSASIREKVRAAVPQYAAALDTAADAISQTKATDLGYDLLRAKTTRADVARGMRNASAAERTAAKQGLRSYIDDQLANVSATLTDPNTDIREGLKLVRDMSSRASNSKMRSLIGAEAAEALSKEIDGQAVAFELRAAIAANSKTAIRQSIQGSVDQVAGPTAVEILGSGKPVAAAQRMVQLFTGNTDEAVALRRSGVFEEIATALTQTRGRKAEAALRHVQRAIDGGRITARQAEFIGTTLAASSVIAGSRTISQNLSIQ